MYEFWGNTNIQIAVSHLYIYTSLMRGSSQWSECRSLIWGEQSPFCSWWLLQAMQAAPGTCVQSLAWGIGVEDNECCELRAEIDWINHNFLSKPSPRSCKASIDSIVPNSYIRQTASAITFYVVKQIPCTSYSSIFPLPVASFSLFYLRTSCSINQLPKLLWIKLFWLSIGYSNYDILTSDD